MDSPLSIGVVGLGCVGRRHCEQLAGLGHRVVGAVKRTPPFGKDPCLGIPVFDSLDGLLSHSRPDALVVASPNALHRGHVLAGLEAGCHVLCEKPLGVSGAEVREMAEAAALADRVLMGGMNLRFVPHFRAAGDVIAKGALGTVRHVQAAWVRRRGIPGPGKWHTDRSLAGGGALLDAGIHVLDVAWSFLGRPRPLRVSATMSGLFRGRLDAYEARKVWNGPVRRDGVMDVEDGCVALVRFEGGATLDLDVAWAVDGPESPFRVVARGDRAGLSWEKTGAVNVFIGEEPPRLVSAVVGPSLHESFAQAVCGGANPCPPSDMLTLARIIDAAYASAERGGEINVES